MLPAILNFIVSPATIHYAIRGLAVSKKLVLPFTLTSIKKRKFDSDENPTKIVLETTENCDLSQNQEKQRSDLSTEKLNETFKLQISDALEKSFMVEESYKEQQHNGPDNVNTEELDTENSEDIIAVNGFDFDQAKTEKLIADHHKNTKNLEELIAVNSFDNQENPDNFEEIIVAYSFDFEQAETKEKIADPQENTNHFEELISENSFDSEETKTQEKTGDHQEKSLSLSKDFEDGHNGKENLLIQNQQDSNTENLDNIAVKTPVNINLYQERFDNHPQTSDITKCSKLNPQLSGTKLTPIQSYTKNGTTFYVYENSGSDFDSRFAPQSTRKLASTSVQKSVPKFLEEPKPRGLYSRIPSYDYDFFLKVTEKDFEEIVVRAKIDRKYSHLINWIKI